MINWGDILGTRLKKKKATNIKPRVADLRGGKVESSIGGMDMGDKERYVVG